MDRRQKKTREAIFSAFTKLLASKSYSKITVQQIIDEANIGRSTFYSHFETKDDLLKEMCTELFQHVFSVSPNTEKTHDFSLAHGDSKAMIAHILYHLRDQRKEITELFTCDSSELFLRCFKEYLTQLITQHLLVNTQRKNQLVSDEFLINHIAGSFVEMVQWWLKNNRRQTPEQLSESFLSVILPII